MALDPPFRVEVAEKFNVSGVQLGLIAPLLAKVVGNALDELSAVDTGIVKAELE